MKIWPAIIGFFASGQRASDVAVKPSGEVLAVKTPISPRITLTTHETGITLDFPMFADARPLARAQAWWYFEVGLFLLMSAVMGYAYSRWIRWDGGIVLAALLFAAGLILLPIGAYFGSNANMEDAVDDDLHQLSVAGNLLVRTVRDQRKKLWYQHEVRDILFEQDAVTITTGDRRAPGRFSRLRLIVLLKNGEQIELLSWYVPHPLTDHRACTEMEWVAIQLRQALLLTSPKDAPHTPTTDDLHAHAIRAKDAPREETRYTE